MAGIIEVLIRPGLTLLSLMDLAEIIELLRMVVVLDRGLVRRRVVLNWPISVRHRPFPIALVARWTLVTHPVLPTPSVVLLKARKVPRCVLLWVPWQELTLTTPLCMARMILSVRLCLLFTYVLRRLPNMASCAPNRPIPPLWNNTGLLVTVWILLCLCRSLVEVSAKPELPAVT